MPDCLHHYLCNLYKFLSHVRISVPSFERANLNIINRLEDVKVYGNTSEAQAAAYDRNHPRYPYKSHGQWLKACYGLVSCTILVMFNGIGPFLEEPFNVRRFIASYIGVSLSHILNNTITKAH